MAKDAPPPLDLDLPFARLAGVELISATLQEVRGRMEWRDDPDAGRPAGHGVSPSGE